MEKVIKHIPIVLLIGVVGRVIVFGAQLSDSITVLAIAGLCFLLSNLKYNQEAIQIQQKLDKLEHEFSKHKEEIADAKQYVSTMKMATTLSGRK